MHTLRVDAMPFKALAALLSLLVVVTPMAALAQEIETPVVQDTTAVTDEASTAYLQIKQQAEADAEADAHSGGYGVAGFFCGIFGWIFALASNPEVPGERVVGKSSSYMAVYADVYKDAVRSKNIRAACTGWGIGAAISVSVMLIVMNSSSIK